MHAPCLAVDVGEGRDAERGCDGHLPREPDELAGCEAHPRKEKHAACICSAGVPSTLAGVPDAPAPSAGPRDDGPHTRVGASNPQLWSNKRHRCVPSRQAPISAAALPADDALQGGTGPHRSPRP